LSPPPSATRRSTPWRLCTDRTEDAAERPTADRAPVPEEERDFTEALRGERMFLLETAIRISAANPVGRRTPRDTTGSNSRQWHRLAGRRRNLTRHRHRP